ncbi:TPM domain-containing protein [Paenibacillus solanacearum]|nr:TPM domain-containing protein [Paenibacillus solanacearum]
MRKGAIAVALLFLVLLAAFPLKMTIADAAAAETKTYVYDHAGVLNSEQAGRLEAMAKAYGAKRQTDIIIVTTKNAEKTDVQKLTEDFYDAQAPGFDKPHGNAVILTLDMNNREVYLAGFYKAEQYLDDRRLDKIRTKLTPDLSSGRYELAFEKYIKTAYKYMGIRPGVNPDNILFNLWFQLATSLGIAGLIVGAMAYRSGGRVTVHRRTYEDTSASRVISKRDQYIHTTTTKQKIPKNKGGGSGGGRGGGGITGGGHSHSGSRGSF